MKYKSHILDKNHIVFNVLVSYIKTTYNCFNSINKTTVEDSKRSKGEESRNQGKLKKTQRNEGRRPDQDEDREAGKASMDVARGWAVVSAVPLLQVTPLMLYQAVGNLYGPSAKGGKRIEPQSCGR